MLYFSAGPSIIQLYCYHTSMPATFLLICIMVMHNLCICICNKHQLPFIDAYTLLITCKLRHSIHSIAHLCREFCTTVPYFPCKRFFFSSHGSRIIWRAMSTLTSLANHEEPHDVSVPCSIPLCGGMLYNPLGLTRRCIVAYLDSIWFSTNILRWIN